MLGWRWRAIVDQNAASSSEVKPHVASIYLIDLQKLSPETGPPKIEHYDEFSEIRHRFICYLQG